MTDRSAANLPLSIVDMVETMDEFHGAGVGMRVAVKLMSGFGGRDVKFPKVPAPDHPVALLLGMEDAAALCKVLDGQQIYVPHGRKARSKRQAVIALQRQGRSRAQIAAALGISERHVRGLSNRPPPPSLPLFPDD